MVSTLSQEITFNTPVGKTCFCIVQLSSWTWSGSRNLKHHGIAGGDTVGAIQPMGIIAEIKRRYTCEHQGASIKHGVITSEVSIRLSPCISTAYVWRPSSIALSTSPWASYKPAVFGGKQNGQFFKVLPKLLDFIKHLHLLVTGIDDQTS